MKHALMMNPVTGENKRCKIGFAWTEFFFGAIDMLIRKNVLLAIVAFIAYWIMGFGFIMTTVIAFTYNKWYVRWLATKKGWRPASTNDKKAFVSKGYLSPSIDVVNKSWSN